MRRVKAIWSKEGTVSLQIKINEWLDANPDIEPVNIAYSRTDEYFSSLILYEIKEDIKQI